MDTLFLLLQRTKIRPSCLSKNTFFFQHPVPLRARKFVDGFLFLFFLHESASSLAHFQRLLFEHMSLVNRGFCAAVFSTVETHCAFY